MYKRKFSVNLLLLSAQVASESEKKQLKMYLKECLTIYIRLVDLWVFLPTEEKKPERSLRVSLCILHLPKQVVQCAVERENIWDESEQCGSWEVRLFILSWRSSTPKLSRICVAKFRLNELLIASHSVIYIIFISKTSLALSRSNVFSPKRKHIVTWSERMISTTGYLWSATRAPIV